MKTQILNVEVNSGKFIIPVTVISDTNMVCVLMSPWGSSLLDMDLDVSYDNGETWLYGGGCKGAVSDTKGIEFHLRYQINPTHIKGRISSDGDLNTTLSIYSGE